MNSGTAYEDKACEFLGTKGYKILTRNFSCRFGEIDIIASNKGYIVFIEVKARKDGSMVSGLEAIHHSKIDKIRKTALFYAQDKPDKKYRFDVLEIIPNKDFLKYNLIQDAFSMTD
jgi:putative endonuclease